MTVTHRLAARYRTRLSILRASITSLVEGSARDVLLDELDALGGDLAMGFVPLEAVPLEEAELELRRTEDGISSILADDAGQSNSDRDSRNHEHIDAENSAA
jgi:hypothetical protein